MTNVIELIPDSEKQEMDKCKAMMDELHKKNEESRQQIREDQERIANITILSSAEKNKVDKKNLLDQKKALEANIKLQKTNIQAIEQQLNIIQTEFAKLKAVKTSQFVKKTSQDTAEKVFVEHNIHYVIFDQQWWSVDPQGGRMDVKINHSDWKVISDLIYYDSNWEITQETELKKIVKEKNRMFKHIVRDFEGQRTGVYNQMETIKEQWLKPTYDVEPHVSFRLLMLSIAGGDEEYADQLERFVAYRYCHPEDVMIPNIDSCAIGGTGRDTFFNILRAIFTDECCGSVSSETFKGTHNADLFGKMLIKVDEKDSHSIPIDKIKEFTGSNRYRHRAMNKDARDVARLFSFIFFRNGFTSTAKLSGTGSSGEDRRFEPIIARINLPRYIAHYHELITDLNTMLTEEQTKAMQIIIKEWQKEYYKNEERITEWLGYIIKKFDAYNMTELLPIHGKYYKEMLNRQQKGIDGFMPKFMKLMTEGASTIINISQAHKIYEVAESQKCKKDWFKNQMMYWLNSKLGWDSEEITQNVYTWPGCKDDGRRKMTIVQNKLNVPKVLMFYLEDFIDVEAEDDKGTTVGEKINIFSIRDELR